MTKLKFWTKFWLALLVILFFIVSLIPVLVYVYTISKTFVIPDINLSLFGGTVLALILLPILSMLYTKLIKVKWHRKLQALAVADELGIVPTTSIIIRRILIMVEYSYGLIMIYLVTNLMKILNAEFNQVAAIGMWLLISYGIFTVLLMITDGIKINTMNKKKVEDEYNLIIQKEELYAKKLIRGKKDATKHAKLKKGIEDLEKVINGE